MGRRGFASAQVEERLQPSFEICTRPLGMRGGRGFKGPLKFEGSHKDSAGALFFVSSL
jgi:hypothetical protein